MKDVNRRLREAIERWRQESTWPRTFNAVVKPTTMPGRYSALEDSERQ